MNEVDNIEKLNDQTVAPQTNPANQGELLPLFRATNDATEQQVTLWPATTTGSGSLFNEILEQSRATLRKGYSIVPRCNQDLSVNVGHEEAAFKEVSMEDLAKKVTRNLRAVDKFKADLRSSLMFRNIGNINILVEQQKTLTEDNLIFEQISKLCKLDRLTEGSEQQIRVSQIELEKLLTMQIAQIKKFLSEQQNFINFNQNILDRLKFQQDYTDFSEREQLIEQQQQNLISKKQQVQELKQQQEQHIRKRDQIQSELEGKTRLIQELIAKYKQKAEDIKDLILTEIILTEINRNKDEATVEVVAEVEKDYNVSSNIDEIQQQVTFLQQCLVDANISQDDLKLFQDSEQQVIKDFIRLSQQQKEKLHEQESITASFANCELIQREIVLQEAELKKIKEQHSQHGIEINIEQLHEVSGWFVKYKNEIYKLQNFMNSLQQLQSEIISSEFIAVQKNCLQQLFNSADNKEIDNFKNDQLQQIQKSLIGATKQLQGNLIDQDISLSNQNLINRNAADLFELLSELHQLKIAEIIKIAKNLVDDSTNYPGTVSIQIKQIFSEQLINIIASKDQELAKNLRQMLEQTYTTDKLAVNKLLTVTDFNLPDFEPLKYQDILNYTNSIITQHQLFTTIPGLIKQYEEAHKTFLEHNSIAGGSLDLDYTHNLSELITKFKEAYQDEPVSKQQANQHFASIEKFVVSYCEGIVQQSIDVTSWNQFVANYWQQILVDIEDKLLSVRDGNSRLTEQLQQTISQTEQKIQNEYLTKKQDIDTQLANLESRALFSEIKTEKTASQVKMVRDSWETKLEVLEDAREKQLKEASITEKRQLKLLDDLPSKIDISLFIVKEATNNQSLIDLFTKFLKSSEKLNFDLNDSNSDLSVYKIFLTLFSSQELSTLIDKLEILCRVNRLFTEKLLVNKLNTQDQANLLIDLQSKLAVIKDSIAAQDQIFMGKFDNLEKFLQQLPQKAELQAQVCRNFGRNLDLCGKYISFAKNLQDKNIREKVAASLSDHHLQPVTLDLNKSQQEINLFIKNCELYYTSTKQREVIANLGHLTIFKQNIKPIITNIKQILTNKNYLAKFQQQCLTMISQRYAILQQQQDLLFTFKQLDFAECEKHLTEITPVKKFLQDSIKELRCLYRELNYQYSLYSRQLSFYLRGDNIVTLLKQRLTPFKASNQQSLVRDVEILNEEISVLENTIEQDLDYMKELLFLMPENNKQHNKLLLEYLENNISKLQQAKELLTELKNYKDNTDLSDISIQQQRAEIRSSSKPPQAIILYNESEELVPKGADSLYLAIAEKKSRESILRETTEDFEGILQFYENRYQRYIKQELEKSAKYKEYIWANLRKQFFEEQPDCEQQFNQQMQQRNYLTSIELTRHSAEKQLIAFQEQFNQIESIPTVETVDTSETRSNRLIG